MDAGKSTSVLLIDDEDALRHAVRRILESEGFAVSEARNGTEGIAFGIGTDFDIALIDLKMPDIGGIEVLKQIRSRKPNTVCYIATAYASYETAIEATRLGADGYILKPFTPEELLQHMMGGMEKRRLLLEAAQLKREREERMLELAFERGRLNTIIRSLADGVLVINNAGEVVYCNPAALQLLSIPDIKIGSSVNGLIPAELEEVLHAVANSPAGGNTAYSIELEIKPDMELFAQATVNPVLHPNGSIAGVVLVLKNITEFKKIEHLKSQFVSMVAHELKAPLAATIGFIDILTNDGIPLSIEQQHDFLHRSHARLSSLLNMVNDLLDISRIEMNKVTREIREINFTQLFGEIAFLFKADLDRKNVILKTDIQPLPGPFYGDYNEISRVFTNLVSNGIKYNRHGGTLSVTAEPVGNYCRISVKDSGIGMKPAEKERLFHEFYRAKNEHTRGITGTGLGLSIVKRVIEYYTGTIQVTSVYGEGSEFTVSLPLRVTDYEQIKSS